MIPQKKQRILIIDDSPENREILEGYLASDDYTIEMACDGEEGLDSVKQNPPDLILLDILMPKIDGFRVCTILKEDKNTRLIPVVMVTALHEKKDRIKGIEVGADDFISIPFDKTELLARVKSLLKMKHFSDQLDGAENVLFALAKAVEAKDKYTEGHTERVADLAAKLGRQANLSEQEQETLYMGGVLHDIGKIGVKDAVLNKPDRLTPEEFEEIKKHPLTGEDICRPLKSIKSLLEIIRHHHEKLDGSGYPDRLKGTEIPVAARIMAIVDVYDALTSDRPYRKGMPKEKALSILEEEASKGWWDKNLLEKFKLIIA